MLSLSCAPEVEAEGKDQDCSGPERDDAKHGDDESYQREQGQESDVHPHRCVEGNRFVEGKCIHPGNLLTSWASAGVFSAGFVGHDECDDGNEGASEPRQCRRMPMIPAAMTM